MSEYIAFLKDWGDDCEAAAWAVAEIDRLRAELAAERAVKEELRDALNLIMQEVVASGNWGAKDFGWPKAVAAAKAVQRHFTDVRSDAAAIRKGEP